MSNKKALIIGAAISGTGAAVLLKHEGYDVYLTDMKAIPEQKELEEKGIRCFPEGHPEALKEQQYDIIVKNPGIPPTAPFVKWFTDRGYKMYNEIEIAVQYRPDLRIGAVTGTNGKTTTTTLLGEILHLNDADSITAGNIGKSLCISAIEAPRKAVDVSLEIAAFQLLGTETFHPKAAVIMNLTPDHLDVFGTTDAYYKAKCLVYKNMVPGDVFFRNVDDPEVMKYCNDVPCDVIDFSIVRNDTALCAKDGAVWLDDVKLFDLQHLHIPGPHNLQNAMAAAGMAYKMGVSPEVIDKAIDGFQGVEHRIEFTAEINGVRYYNDSKGTNTDATIVALKAFDTPIHLLAGGYDKHLPFDGLVPYFDKLAGMYLFGATKDKLKALYPDAYMFDTMEQAIHAAYANAKPGEVVLLSPACASWDQFPNYEVRGRQFKEIVRSLKK